MRNRTTRNMMLLMALKQEGKLTNEFLPPEEFRIIQEKPYSEWPRELQDKLAPWTGKWRNQKNSA